MFCLISREEEEESSWLLEDAGSGFLVFDAVGGGTGFGLGSLLLDKSLETSKNQHLKSTTPTASNPLDLHIEVYLIEPKVWLCTLGLHHQLSVETQALRGTTSAHRLGLKKPPTSRLKPNHQLDRQMDSMLGMLMVPFATSFQNKVLLKEHSVSLRVKVLKAWIDDKVWGSRSRCDLEAGDHGGALPKDRRSRREFGDLN
ncbi:hypothetical protein FH972_012559 [Carpinus fangiana]|uniref:Tubulin/FtsZ GTPase domain-containing protein n=1 Tax=Carpinus fangiana TaxID=176857 RepID=A0A5N6R7H8_9ROSI|nr:hypothetical protein FH972_012559 [Carpinus fangiana]